MTLERLRRSSMLFCCLRSLLNAARRTCRNLRVLASEMESKVAQP